MPGLKRIVLSVVTAPGVTLPLRPLMRGHATVFMLHRFRDDSRGTGGYPPELLRTVLARLRRDGHRFLSLDALVDGLAQGDLPPRAVVFTIDDGYLDQATVGAPVFAEFDCPVTTFVTTGFLDRQLWFWWDRIEYVFRHTARGGLGATLAGIPLHWRWENTAGRDAAQEDFTVRCKRVPDAEKHSAIAELARSGEVELPVEAPPEYAPMSWDQARACERGGMSFGPHTVTHPILSRTPDAQAEHELAESWQRLSAEVARPVPVYCYPNGGPEDFGEREIAILRRVGIRGAVVGDPGYASPTRFGATPDAPFRIRRFALGESLPHVLQCTTGIERLKSLLGRGES